MKSKSCQVVGGSHLVQVPIDGDLGHEGVLHVEGRPLGDVGAEPRHLPRVHLARAGLRFIGSRKS